VVRGDRLHVDDARLEESSALHAFVLTLMVRRNLLARLVRDYFE
jgi:hypothetical protein